MKKTLLTIFVLFVAIFNSMSLLAQSTGTGKRGGVIINAEQQLYFEVVDNGSNITFYPCDAEGKMLNVVPTHADITIVYIATSEQFHVPNVELNNGAFSVTPPRDLPIYMYAINGTFNNQSFGAKYRLPSAERPR